ncbi:MAG: aminoacyl-tRNA hydrolase [Gammaproteobacteria bacterium]|nr:aminoacyl-tRNA hydrolase [Gammaproteobacteria bacterium]
MDSIKLIVGLGNPGSKYDQTRHNAGFWFIDLLARKYGVSLRPDSKFNGEAAKAVIEHRDVWLLTPNTFMNRSGLAVQKLCQFYKIEPQEILVAHDELSFDAGTIRLKTGGGHAGHNGLRDIIAHLGNKDFHRLRIGIGHPGASHLVSDYVLKNPSQDDRISIEASLDRALLVTPLLIQGELQKAFHRLHSD